MNGFKGGQFTRIKDLSDRRRLPRLGKVRLGIKAVSKTTGREYPKETPYFVVPPEVQKIYGDTPIEMEIMIPVNSLDVCFPTRLVWFGASKGIKCIGDGEHAMRVEEPDGTRYKEMKERDCPCELLDNSDPRLKCSKRASLFIILPKVSVSGVYQIDLSSYNSIVDINSGLTYVEALVGRFAMVPLVLKRVPRETHYEGKKAIHYTLQIFLDATDINFINSLRESTGRILAGPKYALPAPEITNPALDDGATIIEVDEETDGETGELKQPPHDDTAQDTGFPTPEEEREALEKAGMAEGSTDRPPMSINEFREKIESFTNGQGLNKWFGSEKKNIPTAIMSEISKMVNDRLIGFKKK